MALKNFVLRGDNFTLKLLVNIKSFGTFSQTDNYYINSSNFSVEALNSSTDMGADRLVRMKFSKITSDSVEETFRVTSKALRIENMPFKNDASRHEVATSLNEIDIKIQVRGKPTLNKFNDLYDDEATTDFELRADDGCVRFHRDVLARSSPVLKLMLSGKWKETTQGQVEVPGITKNTIQQFKDFIYKSVVPENDSLELLSLASYYMMTELEEICAEKIVDTLTSENIWSIMEYCGSHKLKKLLVAILNRQATENVLCKALKFEPNE